MIKRKIDNELRRFYKESSKALLITGARQTGKTFSIRQFGKEFEFFIEINFIEMPEAVNLFKNATDSADILRRISIVADKPLIKNKTLIFFDEVQECPEIVTAIKFLVDEGSYRYILSGSLLGVELKNLRSEPVGYMGVREMFPLSMEEFFTAMGVSESIINHLHTQWELKKPIDEFIHNKMLDLFRLYLIVGGMPAVVAKFIETNNFRNVYEEQRDIIQLYLRDITKYSDLDKRLKIKEIFNLIPAELNAKNKRFILKKLNENAKFDRFEDSFLWLSNAGVALPVYNIEEPKIPLVLSKSRNLFKLFQNDVGLLAAQYADGIQLELIQGHLNINYGAIYENVVTQELKANGFELYYYNNKKRGEIDFVVEYRHNVLPIEVKSGKDYESHRALSNVLACKDYDIPLSLVLCNDNLHCKGDVIYMPVYLLMFLRKIPAVDYIYKPDLTALT